MATITLTFSAAVATRLADALTETQDLETPATEDDVKNFIIKRMKQLVTSSEKRVAAAANAPPAAVDIT